MNRKGKENVSLNTESKESEEINMWLFTKIGFFSVVENMHNANEVLVRSRFREDLEALLSFAGLAMKIDDRSGTDYGFRVFLPREKWQEIAQRLVEGIDYSNFKDAAHSGNSIKDGALFDVWRVMHRAQEKAK